MHRSAFSRILATLVTVWLAVCLVEPAALHTCAMHSGLSIDGSATSHSMHGHTHGDQSSDHQNKQCSCLGDCTAGKSAVGFVSNPIGLESFPFDEVLVGRPAQAAAVAVDPPYLLPFSNGPPVLSRS